MHSHPDDLAIRPPQARDGTYGEYYYNSTGKTINTDAVIVEGLRRQYRNLYLLVTPRYRCNILAYSASGHARAVPADAEDSLSATLKWKLYIPPARRNDKSDGVLAESVIFGKYFYTWKDQEYIVYIVEAAKGDYTNSIVYVLGSSKESTESLVLAASKWMVDLHNEVLVFDGGYWQKSPGLWENVQQASWDDIIMDDNVKKTLIGVVDQFFNSEDKYKKLKVPWKRGVIYHGPPGNGKTISIKAMMHSLYDRPNPIPTLYVRSLSSYGGPEYSIQSIFSKARQTAPCFLVFEDLDSLISDNVRSYFLNEVDGLQSNDGILMLGSTNHLDRLDPGLANRPSRFDRKYYFPNPNCNERALYCEYWRKKLLDNKDIEFPARLDKAIAHITQDFSFAYMQEAFVASLLAIAGEDDRGLDGELPLESTDKYDLIEVAQGLSISEDYDDLDKYVLWRQMKKQIKILRDEMGEKDKTVKGVE